MKCQVLYVLSKHHDPCYLLTEWDCKYVCLQYKVDCVVFARNMLQVVIHNLCKRTYAHGKVPWGKHGAHLGPVGHKWAPCWPHNPCYQGRQQRSFCKRYVEWQAVIMLGLDGSIIHGSLWNMADCKHIELTAHVLLIYSTGCRYDNSLCWLSSGLLTTACGCQTTYLTL